MLYEFQKYAPHEYMCSILVAPIVCGFSPFHNTFVLPKNVRKHHGFLPEFVLKLFMILKDLHKDFCRSAALQLDIYLTAVGMNNLKHLH